MNAIVKISGKQFKVAKDTKLFVNRIDAKEGSKVSFDNVLLVDDGKKVQVGKPNISGISQFQSKHIGILATKPTTTNVTTAANAVINISKYGEYLI